MIPLLEDLRLDIGDLPASTGSYRFTDGYLYGIIEKAGRRINRRLSLTSTTAPIVVDTSGNMTSPVDQDLADLVLLQAECMIANVDVNIDISTGGVYAMDGEQSLDSRARSVNRLAYLGNKYNPCAELEKAIMVEQLRRASDNFKDIW
jgi:hypothetical protein